MNYNYDWIDLVLFPTILVSLNPSCNVSVTVGAGYMSNDANIVNQPENNPIQYIIIKNNAAIVPYIIDLCSV